MPRPYLSTLPLIPHLNLSFSPLLCLASQGISPLMINRFFKPFFQGIFLSPLNLQSSRMFEFVFKVLKHNLSIFNSIFILLAFVTLLCSIWCITQFCVTLTRKMFTTGSATLPEYGMGQIGTLIAQKIPGENMLLNTKYVLRLVPLL